MNVKGNHEFKVSRQQLWEYLMSPEVLAKITPGVTKLQILDTDTYKSISDIKIGPVKGSFSGKLKVENKNEPESFEIVMEQLSKIGNAHATVFMNLDDKGEELSALSFKGKAKLSGVIARTGQRVLSSVATALTKEVFAALEQHIEENRAKEEETPQKDESPSLSDSINFVAPAHTDIPKKEISIPEEVVQGASEKPKNFFAGIIHFFQNIFKTS